MPLRDYLASRVLEVVVHADDVATGGGIAAPTFDAVVVDVAVLRAFTRSNRVTDPYDVLRVL